MRSSEKSPANRRSANGGKKVATTAGGSRRPAASTASGSSTRRTPKTKGERPKAASQAGNSPRKRGTAAPPASSRSAIAAQARVQPPLAVWPAEPGRRILWAVFYALLAVDTILLVVVLLR